MSKVKTVLQTEITKPPKPSEAFGGLPRSTIKVLKSGMFNPVEAIRSLREK
jgi:hypothetical protein